MDRVFERYRNDATFHRMVEMIRGLLTKDTTPSELREALMLAMYMHEMDNPDRYVFRVKDLADEFAADIAERRHRRR